jgi:hypothetical protein
MYKKYTYINKHSQQIRFVQVRYMENLSSRPLGMVPANLGNTIFGRRKFRHRGPISRTQKKAIPGRMAWLFGGGGGPLPAIPGLRGTCTSLCNGIEPAAFYSSFAKKTPANAGVSYWWRRRDSLLLIFRKGLDYTFIPLRDAERVIHGPIRRES